MRAIMVVAFLAIAGTAWAQDVVLSKQELIETIAPEVVESTCTPALLACLELSKSACTAQVNELAGGACAKDVPEAGLGIDQMDKMKEIAKAIAGCVSSEIVSQNNKALLKNVNTAACQALLE